MRKTFTPHQKAQVAIAALKGDQTIAQIASTNEVHPTQIKQWEKIAKEGLPTLFVDKRSSQYKEKDDARARAPIDQSHAPMRAVGHLSR